MKLRLFDEDDKIMYAPVDMLELIETSWELTSVDGEHVLPKKDYLQFCKNKIWTKGSNYMDKNGDRIFEGDIVKVERKSDEIFVVCRYGMIRRQMATGFLVDIHGFYLERMDGTETFPIAQNYKGEHDFFVFEIVSNIFENPELFQP